MKEKWKVNWDNKDSHLVKDYDYWHDIYISKRQEMLNVFTFVKNIYQPKALEILDIGCGTGAVSLNLLESNQNVHATLIDGSPVVGQYLVPQNASMKLAAAADLIGGTRLALEVIEETTIGFANSAAWSARVISA